MVQIFRSGYGLLRKTACMLQCPFLLVIRLYWGWQFFITGKGKLADIDKIIGFFTNLGIPYPTQNAYFVSSLECVGGLLLIAGLGSRLISIPLIFSMCVAYLTADQEALRNIFSDPDKFFAATPFLFLYALVIIFLFGPGRISLDYFLFHRGRGESCGKN